METYVNTQPLAPSSPGAGDKQRIYDHKLFDECQTLLGLLLRKTEALYHECQTDLTKASHIRDIGSALAALTVMMTRLETLQRDNPEPVILQDGMGNTYQSVRWCDIDRFIDK